MEPEDISICLARHGERIDQLLAWREEMTQGMKEVRAWSMGIMGGLIVALIMLTVGLLRGARI